MAKTSMRKALVSILSFKMVFDSWNTILQYKVHSKSTRTTYTWFKKISLIGKIHNTKREKVTDKAYDITNVKMVKCRSNNHTYCLTLNLKTPAAFSKCFSSLKFAMRNSRKCCFMDDLFCFEFLSFSFSPSISAAQSNFYLSKNPILWF